MRQADRDAPIFASVFVPQTAKDALRNKVEKYRSENTPSGRPKNEPLVASIETVRLARSRALFTDVSDRFPTDQRQEVWWEVWLRSGKRTNFERVAASLNIRLKSHAVSFAERDVLLALGSVEKIDRLILHCDAVAELRRASDTARFFTGLRADEQHAWSDDLFARLRLPAASSADVAVCILDSGVARLHPLITPVLDDEDCHSIDPAWNRFDTPDWRGHGTAMAGLALHGDLTPVLAGRGPVVMTHRLESVRILPPAAQSHEPDLYGAVTGEAIGRVEIQAPTRLRVFACAVSSRSTTRGRPSSWSAELDSLAFEDPGRLVVVAAGNIADDLRPADYTGKNDVSPIDDPGQSWNALTVGACTDMVNIADADFADYRPIAPAGDLSPRSRTSSTWDRRWPIKPEIVLEGGNLAHDGRNTGEDIDDLQLLTTHFRPTARPFTTLGDTSAATALVARMAAAIRVERPRLRPETVRGLIVHSAEWTPPMRAHIDACDGSKTRIVQVMRRYGYGVPDLDRALRSARNDLTMIVEDEIHPFKPADPNRPNGAARLCEMRLHKLPWPKAELAALGEAEVELRVTLSYFVEPNPGERGWTRRHRYASHGLRFRVKSAADSIDEFRRRVNAAARSEEDDQLPTEDGENWLIGTGRDVGSVHSDIWRGTAADLAERDAIGVYPVGGWWKEKPHLGRVSQPVTYTILCSLRAPGIDVDIYTPVEVEIAITT